MSTFCYEYENYARISSWPSEDEVGMNGEVSRVEHCSMMPKPKPCWWKHGLHGTLSKSMLLYLTFPIPFGIKLQLSC